MLDILALGVIIPVLPKLVEGFLGGDTAQAARVREAELAGEELRVFDAAAPEAAREVA